MSVVNFFKDLGIIPNKGTEHEKNENLLQGQYYKDYERLYMEIAKPHIMLLEHDSKSPVITSVIEAIDGDESITKRSYTPIINDNNTNENNFNKYVAEYSLLYKTLIEELIKQKNNKDYDSDSELNKKLDELNKKLIVLSQKIEDDTNNIKAENNNMKQLVKNKQNVLNAHINSIKQQSKKNKLLLNNATTINGQKETSELLLKSNYYLYIFWILFFLIILFLIIRTILVNSSNNILLLTLIIFVSGVFLYLKT